MAVCIINLSSIPMLAQLRSDRSAANQAFLVKIPNPTGKTSAYYFVNGGDTLAQLDKCPLTRKNKYHRVDLSEMPDSYFDALMGATEDEHSSPNGEKLEEAWAALDVLATQAGRNPFSWGPVRKFKEMTFEYADYSSLDSRVRTVILSDRDLTDEGDFTKIILSGSGVINCILNGMKCEGASFALATVSDSQFIGTNLRKASLAECTATNANFSRADLRGTNFTDATLAGAIFKHAIIDETTNFTGTRYADFPKEFFLFIGDNPKETAVRLLQHYLVMSAYDSAMSYALERVLDQEQVDGVNFEWIAREAMKSTTYSEVCISKVSGEKIPSVAQMLKFAELTPTTSGGKAPVCTQPSSTIPMVR